MVKVEEEKRGHMMRRFNPTEFQKYLDMGYEIDEMSVYDSDFSYVGFVENGYIYVFADFLEPAPHRQSLAKSMKGNFKVTLSEGKEKGERGIVLTNRYHGIKLKMLEKGHGNLETATEIANRLSKYNSLKEFVEKVLNVNKRNNLDFNHSTRVNFTLTEGSCPSCRNSSGFYDDDKLKSIYYTQESDGVTPHHERNRWTEDRECHSCGAMYSIIVEL